MEKIAQDYFCKSIVKNNTNTFISNILVVLGLGTLVVSLLMVFLGSDDLIGFAILIGCIGSLVFLMGLLCKAATTETYLTEAWEYDEFVKRKIRLKVPNPKQYLGIDEDEVMKSISFSGYDFATAHHWRKGDDDVWRSDVFGEIRLFFTESEICALVTVFDANTNGISLGTNAYYYDDIVNVATENHTIEIGELEETISYNLFCIEIKNGSKLTVGLREKIDWQDDINKIRKLIRTKKK